MDVMGWGSTLGSGEKIKRKMSSNGNRLCLLCTSRTRTNSVQAKTQRWWNTAPPKTTNRSKYGHEAP